MDEKLLYDKMSWLYNALYGEKTAFEIKNDIFLKTHQTLWDMYGSEASIIDAACGNGIQATALALSGYRVTATDISKEMINLTIDFAKKHFAQINIREAAWIELPKIFNTEFDIVLCTGNSLVHSENAEQRMKNILAFKKILKTNGMLVIETRNWDKVLLDNPKYTCDGITEYKGNEYIPLYLWHLNGMEHKATVDILFQEIQRDSTVCIFEKSLSFTPFMHDVLLETLENLEMKVYKDTYSVDTDWYFIYAQKI